MTTISLARDLNKQISREIVSVAFYKGHSEVRQPDTKETSS